MEPTKRVDPIIKSDRKIKKYDEHELEAMLSDYFAKFDSSILSSVGFALIDGFQV